MKSISCRSPWYMIWILVVVGLVGCARKDSVSNSTDSDSAPHVNLTERLSDEDPQPQDTFPPIDREPSYRSNPCYVRIAIGYDRDKVIWTIADLDSQLVYVDLNSDGDLTESDEAFELRETTEIQGSRNFSATVPEVSQGKDIHTNLNLKFTKTGDAVQGTFSLSLWGSETSTMDADLIPMPLSREPGSAPVVHFNGPLTMGNYRNKFELTKGKEIDFYSLVGTQGQGSGSFTAISNTTIPQDANPMAEFEFPHRDPSKPAIRVKTHLTVRC